MLFKLLLLGSLAINNEQPTEAMQPFLTASLNPKKNAKLSHLKNHTHWKLLFGHFLQFTNKIAKENYFP